MTSENNDTPLRYLFALPGFHQEDRGAEVALLSVAEELARMGNSVLVIGTGAPRPGASYGYRQVRAINRRKLEKLPNFPPFRSETAWEDAFFAWGLRQAYRPEDYDLTVTCNFPFTHWTLRRGGQQRPRHLYVTQNGNWPAICNAAEFRFFDCDGLVCTNPDFLAETRSEWRTALIPNGIDPERFRNVTADRAGLGLPADRKIVLMVSALIDTKRVLDGIRATARLPQAHLAVAGDGPLRQEVDDLARELLPGRFTRLTVPAARMPSLYRSTDCFLHMSFTEAFGNVYVEAMASGLPIVAHDSERVRWIVGERDTLCDTEDEAATVAALALALERGRGSPDERAQSFTWPKIARQYQDFAREVLAGRGST